jgi:membrane protein DedA with SNARE-associated domain
MSLTNLLNLTYGTILGFISAYSYLAIFILLLLEAASLPIPSEVILPMVGALIGIGALRTLPAFAAVMLGGIVGMGIDYYIAYFLGKDVVYRHLHFFHIKKASVVAFDKWFERNGTFTVFVARLLPVIRGLINFPAGFAQMPLKKFYAYSIAGTAIWDATLMAFGVFAIALGNIYLIFAAVAALSIVLFLMYRFAARRMKKTGGRSGRSGKIKK